MKKLKEFVSYIAGDFNNEKQIKEEINSGSQIHPRASHVNNVFNDRIENLPEGFDGVFILEESYYEKIDGNKLSVPHLFLFKENSEGKVELSSYQFPQGVTRNDVMYSNKNLKFDYNKLKLSKTFNGMIYDYNEESGFHGTSINHFPNDITFTLTETISKNTLIVMELMEKDNKVLTPYKTPIIYDKLI